MTDAVRPFISYAHEDRAEAIRLYGDLRALGAEPWFDAVHLLPGQDWEHTIREALRMCTHFVALMSKKSVDKRGYVQKELRTAFDMLAEFPPDQIFLIPVRLEDVEPRHDQLRRIQWADLFADRKTALMKVAQSLQLPVGASDVHKHEFDRVVTARALWRKHTIEVAKESFRVEVNDFLPAGAEVYTRLTQCVKYLYRFSELRSTHPPPFYSVIVAGPTIGMTALRVVCDSVAPTGAWFLQLWRDGIKENAIVVGSYGYGSKPATRVDADLLAAMRRRAFTKSRLSHWIRERSVILDADYVASDG